MTRIKFRVRKPMTIAVKPADKFMFEAGDRTVVSPGILEVNKPSDRLGDFTVVRASDASYTDSSGVIQIAPDNVARIDYTNGVAELLTEPQSTNLIHYSEDFSDASWTKVGSSTVTINSIISPSGQMNGSTFNASSSAYGTILRYSIIKTDDTPYSLSVFVKKDNYRYVGIRIGNAASSDRSNFYDFDTDTINNTNVPAAPLTRILLSNGWVKLIQSFTTGTPSSTVTDVAITDSNGFVGFTPIGTEKLSVWGAQLEALPYATSYIPTSGSTVTRLQDTITDGGNVNVINSEEGVMFFEGSALFDDGTIRKITINNGSNTESVAFTYSNVSNRIDYEIYNGTSQAVGNYVSPDVTANMKVAVKWKLNDFAFWVNGVKLLTDNIGTTPLGLNNIDFDRATLGLPFFGRTRALKVYDHALTDEELEQITSLEPLEIPTNINLTEV